MSADNWTTCPRCSDARVDELQAAEKALKDSYGKVPLHEFVAARESLHDKFLVPLNQNWREDYEIFGAETGLLEIHYEGRCAVCKHSYKYNHAIDINPV
jgi:hypothetical protein